MRKNSRQAYGVMVHFGPSGLVAGMQHSAKSWGTGRAVSRIPRVSGGGTSRSGQGAFGNMCRGGRMFNPTKTYRKWHRKINTNEKRYAVCSALAASASAPLLMARGHEISNVSEVPLVVESAIESVKTTKEAIAVLKAVKAYGDVEKVIASKKLRAGKGKMRNRRTQQKLGPLVVYAKNDGLVRAFRGIAGVELASVESLNLLQLAPGGHVGRFIIFSQGAFEKLDKIFGTTKALSEQKSGYKLPRNIVVSGDLKRLVNSDAVQTALKPAQSSGRAFRLKKNPLKNLGEMVKLNPYALAARRAELLRSQKDAKKDEVAAAKRA
ncbi:MAG: hypothetical protein MHM6MM_001006 [Cercozoa sp. M6MM]